MNNNLSVILSIIGCITGVAGLLIHFYKFILERPKLKIELDKMSHSYYFKALDFKVERYITNYCAVISLKISNCSTYPLSIDSVFSKADGSKFICRHNPEFKFQPKSIKIGEKTTTSYIPSVPMSVPLRVEPFDTVFVSIRFPFFDCFVDKNIHETPVKVKLALNTPHKRYHYKVELYEYMCYHALRHSPRRK